jgi:hypothetical protein
MKIKGRLRTRKPNGLVAIYMRKDPLWVCDSFVFRTVSRHIHMADGIHVSRYSVFAHLRGYSDSTTPLEAKYHQ